MQAEEQHDAAVGCKAIPGLRQEGRQHDGKAAEDRGEQQDAADENAFSEFGSKRILPMGASFCVVLTGATIKRTNQLHL